MPLTQFQQECLNLATWNELTPAEKLKVLHDVVCDLVMDQKLGVLKSDARAARAASLNHDFDEL